MSKKPYIDPAVVGKVELLLNSSQRHMADALGIVFISFKPDEIKAVMPVSEQTVQPFGILHGGASAALAETLSSIGAWLNTEEKNQSAVGVEINANHIRPVPLGGEVYGTSIPVHRGKKIQVWETKIYDSNGKLVCVSRCTLTVVKSRK